MRADELRTRFPNASQSFLRANADRAPVAPRLPDAKPKQAHRDKPVEGPKPAKEGTAGFVVVITRCSTGSLDRDNLWGGTKALGDALHYSGRTPGDTESDIELIVLQKRVRRRNVGTLVEIIPLTNPVKTSES